MSKLVDRITDLVAPHIAAPYELVDVTYEKRGSDAILSVFIDKIGGMTVEDTADLTEVISPLLDTLEPDPFPEQYYLEVSSPGLERPLKTKDALMAAVGSYIHLSFYRTVDGLKSVEGTLLAFDGEELDISYQDKTRQKNLLLPYEVVAKARLAVKL